MLLNVVSMERPGLVSFLSRAISGKRFSGTCSPFYDDDDDGSLIGIIPVIRVMESLQSIRFSPQKLKNGLGILWPWKGNEQEGSNGRPTHSVCPLVQNEQKKDKSHQISPSSDVNCESHASESSKSISKEASSWSSSINANSTSGASSCESTSSSLTNKVDTDSNCSEYEILWDNLTIREQIGPGSCGTVYHGLWFGSDVAVNVFSKQEYSEEFIQSFRQEVSLMKRLRHPNVLLFMGAVTSPQRLCRVSELLPRFGLISFGGSLFRLLQRSKAKLDWRRRIQMALDNARGMNYLLRCSRELCDVSKQAFINEEHKKK